MAGTASYSVEKETVGDQDTISSPAIVSRSAILKLLRQHEQDFVTFGVQRLALFGSVARDEAGADSDVDLLVEFAQAPTFDCYTELAFFLEDLLQRRVDLLTYSSLRDTMRCEIEPETIDVAELSPLSR